MLQSFDKKKNNIKHGSFKLMNQSSELFCPKSDFY